jgi:hypothetical protein
MFVSIDMDELRFLHKHHDHETVSRLSWLECGQHTSIRIDNTDADNFLRGVAHGDLLTFYGKVTGDDTREAQWGDRAEQFRERLREAALNLPPTVALIEEVDAQVAAVDDRLYAGERFKYVLGSRVPAQAQELFPLVGRPLTQQQTKAADARAEEKMRAHAALREAERRGDLLPQSARDQLGLPPLPGAAPAAPDAPAAPAAAEPSGSTVRSKGAAGATRAVVNAAADKAWEEAGRPTGEAELKAIAKGLHAGIAAQGHNPTTTRIKLTEWTKAKLASFQA